MSAGESDVVTGTLYGSAVGLFVALTTPLLLVSVPLSAAGIWSWAGPVVAVLVGAAVAPWLRRRSTLTVSDEGVTLLRSGRLTFVPWSSVGLLSEGWFPTLVFDEPQKMGRRRVSRLRIDSFDPKWRRRPTTTAIVRELARNRTEGP